MSAIGGCDPAERLAALTARLEELLGQDRIADDFVRFRISLAQEQSKVYRLLAGAAVPALENTARAATAVLDGDSLALRQEPLAAYFAGLIAAVMHHGRGNEELKQLQQAVAAGSGQLEDLVRMAGIRPRQESVSKLSAELSASENVLQFIAHTLAAPFAASSRMQLAVETAPSGNPSGNCAFCGSAAALAKLRRDDGKRSLYCSLCGLEWAYKRIGCPFCGNENQAELNMLYVSEKDYCWVETCEQCKCYVKVFDERRRDEGWELEPYVEDTATLFLDLLAEREGYLRMHAFAPAL